MRKICVLLAVVLASCGAPAVRPASPSDRIVVLISIDGFPAYALEDPRLPAPTLQRLMREGSSARGMTIVNPAVTWPNHTTLATGVAPARHGVLYNGLLLAEPGKPPRVEQRSRADLLRVPTVYDLAHQAGLSTAQVDWVPWQTGGTIDWAFEENPDPKGGVEREMIAAGLITEPEVAEFKKSNPAWRDQMWTRAAVHILRTHRPNLLLFHLLNLDATHHRYGPKTPASMTGIALADHRIAEILAALDETGLKDKATVIVVSDHGFKGTRKSIRPNAALAKAGRIKVEGGKIVACDAYAIPEGGTAMLYITNEEEARSTPRILETLLSLEGVEKALSAADYPALGLPTPKENAQMPPYVLVAKPGYAFDKSFEGEPVVEVVEGITVGHHGYLTSDPDMNAIFIAWGRGIRRGGRVETLRNVDVAPTVAALLGLRMDGADGSPAAALLD
jgi:predicted AlkP superfamily pyrophosphatase or phosphodiesterase